MGVGMLNDVEVLRQITDVKDVILDVATLNLRLFVNDIIPAPGDVIGAYTQATFDGYAAKDVTGAFAAPVQDEAGIYSSRSTLQTWNPPGAGAPQDVRGIYLTVNNGVDPEYLIFALRFDNPVTMAVGGDPLSLRVVYRQYAAALLEGA